VNLAHTCLPALWVIPTAAAILAGAVFGVLTYMQSKGSWPAVALACLSAAGATLLGTHELLVS
jgi:hypothetical protein